MSPQLFEGALQHNGDHEPPKKAGLFRAPADDHRLDPVDQLIILEFEDPSKKSVVLPEDVRCLKRLSHSFAQLLIVGTRLGYCFRGDQPFVLNHQHES